MTEKTLSSPTFVELPSAYDRWRRSRLGQITDALEQDLLLGLIGPMAGLRVLDVGCGDGQWAITLAKAGARVYAIDTDSRMLDAARRRFEAEAVEVHLDESDAKSLPFESESFDIVTAVTVLCFTREPERALAEMARVLKPDGRLVIGELGRDSVWALWRRARGWLGHTIWRAARFWTAGELRGLVTTAGLSVATVRAGVFYPPIGLIAAALAPLDRWLGRWLVTGGAFLVLVAKKSSDEESETECSPGLAY